MTEYELDNICSTQKDCGCKCLSCPFMAEYMNESLGLDEQEDDNYYD